MLSINKPLMKANLNLLLTAAPGNPMYDAAYNAYYNANKSAIGVVSPTDDPSGISNTSAVETNGKIKELAGIFAKEFCTNLQLGGFMDTIADEVDKHIKSIALSINIPALPPTLVSPAGPVTGSLLISTLAGAQITIS